MATTEDVFAQELAPVPVAPESPERVTQTREFHGREVKFRSFSDAQLAQLNHESTILQSDRYDSERKRKAMDRCFRALQSMFVDEDDLEFAADLIADGLVNLDELMTIATELMSGVQTNRQVRRGRTPRRK